MAEEVVIVVHTDSDAFAEEPASELARILRELATRFEQDGCIGGEKKLPDLNGNTVGLVHINPLKE